MNTPTEKSCRNKSLTKRGVKTFTSIGNIGMIPPMVAVLLHGIAGRLFWSGRVLRLLRYFHPHSPALRFLSGCSSGKLFSSGKMSLFPAFIVGMALVSSLGYCAPPLANPGHPATQRSPVDSPDAPLGDGEWIARLHAIDWTAENIEVDPLLVSRMADSATLLGEMLKAFQAAGNFEIRRQIGEVLASVRSHGVRETAMKWASDPTDAASRLNGFMLLAELEPDDKGVDFAIMQLDLEQDPKVLAWAIQCVARIDIPTPDLAQRVIGRLSQLTRHPDGHVRSSAIQNLSRWDKGLRQLPADVERLLADPDRNVRIAAIGATSMACLSTAAVKKRLLQMLGDAREDPEVRGVALMNLDRFEFSNAEYSELIGSRSKFVAAVEEMPTIEEK